MLLCYTLHCALLHQLEHCNKTKNRNKPDNSDYFIRNNQLTDL